MLVEKLATLVKMARWFGVLGIRAHVERGDAEIVAALADAVIDERQRLVLELASSSGTAPSLNR